MRHIHLYARHLVQRVFNVKDLKLCKILGSQNGGAEDSGFYETLGLVVGEIFADISQDHSTEIFRIKRPKNNGPLVPQGEATTILQNVRTIPSTAQR
jgi:hypothetical protein